MANEFVIKNGLVVQSGTTTVTGSVTATAGFTGSLFGTASVATSLAGGALTNFIEGFSSATQATSFLSASNAASTVNIAIVPKGSGSILGSVPNGAASGGNARGIGSIDLQVTRSAATQVASGNYSVIGGGISNMNQGLRSVVVGGNTNKIENIYGLTMEDNYIGGGSGNIIYNNTAVIVGGSGNSITGYGSVIVGGYSNSCGLTGQVCFIGGGQSNTIDSSQYAKIGGGLSNTITSAAYGTIGGGRQNTTSGQYGTVGGGQSNTAGGQWAVVGGGRQNGASNSYGIVGGGYANSAAGQFSFIGGGSENYVSFTNDTICGGANNSLGGTNNSNHRFIGGGQRNTINAEQTYGTTICGGSGNTIYFGSAGGFIGGGGYAAFPGGNFLTGMNSAIVGGQGNRIGSSSPINYATYCFIGGGGGNTIAAESDYSVITGGAENTINATIDYATITGGYRGIASLYGQQAHASGRFSANGDAQAHELIWRNLITGTNPTELFLDGSSIRAVLPATNAIWRGIVDITAVCTVAGSGTTVVGDVAAASYGVTVKRLNTTTSPVGSTQIIGTLDADTSMSTANFTIGADDTNEALGIVFTPPLSAAADTVFRVVATFRGQQIQY